jgi:hypothetical protein
VKVTVGQVDLDIEGIDGPNHEIEEQDPGGFIALGGARKRVLLAAAPPTVGTMDLEVTAGAGKVEIYDAETGGTLQTGDDLIWETTADMPGELGYRASTPAAAWAVR